MYRKISEIAQKAGKNLTLFNYTTDLQKEHDSGRLSMVTTAVTISPKDEDIASSSTTEPTPQGLKAYNLWHIQELPLPKLCVALGSKESPLKQSTVMCARVTLCPLRWGTDLAARSYVVKALQTDNTLAFSLPKLKELIQQEIGSWSRHGWWIHKLEAQNRVRAKHPSISDSQPKEQ
jgi:hypothetical protein